MSSKIDYTDIRDDRIRSEICDIMSEMLDNPLECGLYRTSKFMWKMETFILAEAKAQAKEIERLKAQIEDLNESLMIAYVDGVYEGRKSKESEIKRLQSELERYKKCFAEAEVENSRIKTAIQQCLTGNAHLADGDNCGLAGPKQAMKE